MQARDPMRERARLEAANREAAYRKPAEPTAALKRLTARSRVHIPRPIVTPAPLEGGGPGPKPLVR